MPNIIKKLDFTTQTAADPYVTVPAGWEYSVGSQQGRTFNISAVSWTAKSVQSNIISSTPMQGTWIQSTVRLSTSQSNVSGASLWIKGHQNRYVDIRKNYFDSSWSGYALDVYLANDGNNYVTGDIDVSYNLLLGSTTGIQIARASQLGARLPVWTRRNTIVNAGIIVYTRAAESTEKTVESRSDVVQTTTSTTDPFKMFCHDSALGTPIQPLSYAPYCFLTCLNYECHGNSGIVDANGLLTGSYRTNYLGRRGHEIHKP